MKLFINACVREESRTKLLSDAMLFKLGAFEEVRLENIDFPKTNESFLKKRDSLIASQSFDDPIFTLARQFANAEIIVIAAPYWDLSFPAMLKQYIEHINVLGITFEYTPDGIPIGLCKAKKLYYVMTAGGTFVPEEFGFGYIKSLAESFYGIKDVELIKAIGLDVYGADEKAILKDALKRMDG